MYDLCYVENLGDKPLQFPIPGYKKSKILPGERQLFPFDVAASAFGHPMARNEGQKNPARDEMHAQLRVYWGYCAGFDVETEDMVTETGRRMEWSSWEAKRPQFRVTTMEGEYIPMVLDDPEGVEPLPDDEGIADPSVALASKNQAVLERTLTAMAQRQEKQDALIASLLQRLDAQGTPATDVDLDDEPVPSSFGPASSSIDPAAPPVAADATPSSELPTPSPDEDPPRVDRPRAVRAGSKTG